MSRYFSVYGVFFAGTTGIVDYTNYDDMKHAVSFLSLIMQ